MRTLSHWLPQVFFICAVVPLAVAHGADPELFPQTLNVNVPSIHDDPTVNYDYDIVYVRAQRAGDEVHKRFYTDFSQPVTMEPGADLMLLHPDGAEELLVPGGDGSITDPMISFDGQWCYYVQLYDLRKANQWNPPSAGADIFKIHLKTRRIVRLTNQQFTPNTGAANWAEGFRSQQPDKTWIDYGVFNMGPCPLPGGRVAFVSNRDGFRPSKGYPAVALQLFVMDDREESIGAQETPRNLEKIGHFNISGALHPVVLRDGRIMFSTLESQGIRSNISWGIWTIRPDGTQWAPLVSAFDPGGAPNGFHFQTQLSNGEIVVEEYYNQNNSGFGAYIKLPERHSEQYPPFGPGYMQADANKPWRYGRFYNAKPQWYRMPFMPTDSVSLTPFTHGREGPANPSVYNDKQSPAVGKFTHPSGAPDNHLLTVYSPGPVNHQYRHLPQLDGGIYLLKNGAIAEQPSDLRVIKNDPRYNECWPRAVVPYRRVYGITEPTAIEPLANDGSAHAALPAGTPFGLVGTSSFYKRESYPNGQVHEGEVTARASDDVLKRDPWKGLDAFTSHGNGMPLNWHNQGGDAGLYSNEDIVAVRILAMPPTTDRDRGDHAGRGFYSHATERLRILGEIPLRKFKDGQQPLDPDGNPDTSFLAKIPADTAFTFQTIDKRGMALNMSQTWHQLRPGEVRHDCGGCHAHSQKPTLFSDTAAARDDYTVWDLTQETPLLTAKPTGQGSPRWNREDSVTLRRADAEVTTVEYFRDVQPILRRSCVACHTSQDGKSPAGNLDLDADSEWHSFAYDGKFPGTYYRLALDERAQFGHKPFGYDSYGYPNASRYIRKFQSRRSLLVWKLYGERLDGFSNDDHPSPAEPGDRTTLLQAGKPVDPERNRARWDLDLTGSPMPPEAAVRSGKVTALTDEDRRTIVRWIDLGCPIEDADPSVRGFGWSLDDERPVVTLAKPSRGAVGPWDSILIGVHDYDSGVELSTLEMTANFQVNQWEPGANLARHFRDLGDGRYQLPIDSMQWPVDAEARPTIRIRVRDRQGNWTTLERALARKP
ncbi:MAG: hypothetical protein KDB14_14700 [Planctomycetales bacterium]|nr:hypothetical protein [Planctomycetales bacterium]